ncbi:MAG: hypothetical protein H5T69_02155 [Chloroflexi bacterium]|nr:hypothetical protein [Chloroflexota bacterium]
MGLSHEGKKDAARPEPAIIYTVGRSNHEIEPLLALLRRHGVTLCE